MVDVYEIAPHDRSMQAMPAPYAYAGHEARMARYQNLLSKLSQEDLTSASRVDGDDAAAAGGEDDAIELQKDVVPVKPEAGGPLVGNFVDAVAAMR